MVKGIKREIILLQEFDAVGKSMFECAYFVLRPNVSDASVAECEMLSEANRIIEAAARVNRVQTGVNGKKLKNVRARKRKSKNALVFFIGFFVGAALAIAAGSTLLFGKLPK